MQVEADEARATGLNFENSEWNLTGSVRIHVPDGRLNSGEATVTFRNNEISRAVIRGQPASFEQHLKEEQKLARGRASSIEYDVQAGTVRLTGNAWLTDGQNEIQGDTLIYDIGQQRIVGKSDRQRSRRRAHHDQPRQRIDEHERGAQGSDSMSLLRAEALGKSYRSRQVVKDLSTRSGLGRGRRVAGAQRRRQDDGLLHDRGSRAQRCRSHLARRSGAYAPADVPPRAARRGLPAAGSVGVPQAVGRGQHPRDPRDPHRARRRPTAKRRSRRCSRSCTSATSARARA